jgi:hypothetical protein
MGPVMGVVASVSTALAQGPTLRPYGYVDVGWFDAGGDGASYARIDDCDDPSCDLFEAHETVGWVFRGDPWASAVNSQGEPADIGNGFNPHPRYDRIASGGRPTFLVNALEAGVDASTGPVGARAAIRVEPARGLRGSLGDQVALDLAFVRWRSSGGSWTVEAGQIESAFGLEWWSRRAPDRWNITPSLMARYTTGTPVGVAVRGDVDGRFQLDVSATNGDTSTERFGHIVDPTDTNGVPTLTVRVGGQTGGPSHVRFGVSGEAGPQDELVELVPMFLVGADLSVNTPILYVRAEYLVVRQDLGEARGYDAVNARGGWAEVAVPLGAVWPLVRVDHRDAQLSLPGVGSFYDSDVARLTAGARWTPSPALSIKAEVLGIWQIGGPAVRDNVLTTSVVYAVR